MQRSKEKILSVSVVLVLFLFTYIYAVQYMQGLEGHQLAIDWYLLSLSLTVYAGYFILGAGLWYASYSSIAGRFPRLKALKIYSSSNLGKYIPGKIGLVLGRGYFAKREGGSMAMGSASVIVEEMLKGLAALFVGIIHLPFLFLQFTYSIAGFGLIVALTLLLFHPRIFKKVLNAVSRRLVKKELEYRPDVKRLFFTFLVFIISWYLFGAIVWLTMLSLGTYGNYFLLTSVFAISWLISFIAFIIPAGIGIREGVFVFLMNPYYGPVSIILALVIRLQTIAIDVAFAVATNLKGVMKKSS